MSMMDLYCSEHIGGMAAREVEKGPLGTISSCAWRHSLLGKEKKQRKQ